MVLRKSCGDAFIVGGYGVRWKMCEGRVGGKVVDSWSGETREVEGGIGVAVEEVVLWEGKETG